MSLLLLFAGGAVPQAPAITVTSGGGTSRPYRKLPQYYSSQIYDSGRIALPQETKSNEIAISVLDDAKELQARLEGDDGEFAEMLEVVNHLHKQVAVYVESRQIYNVITDIELRIRVLMDARRQEQEDEEFEELIALL